MAVAGINGNPNLNRSLNRDLLKYFMLKDHLVRVKNTDIDVLIANDSKEAKTIERNVRSKKKRNSTMVEKFTIFSIIPSTEKSMPCNSMRIIRNENRFINNIGK
jgi:hypothetical protein